MNSYKLGMDGLQPVFKLADDHLRTLQQSRRTGDKGQEQAATEHLKRILEGLDRMGFDEKQAATVAVIREAVG